MIRPSMRPYFPHPQLDCFDLAMWHAHTTVCKVQLRFRNLPRSAECYKTVITMYILYGNYDFGISKT